MSGNPQVSSEQHHFQSFEFHLLKRETKEGLKQ